MTQHRKTRHVDIRSHVRGITARVQPWLSPLVLVVMVAGLTILLAACSLFGGDQVNNVFSNISDGLSQ